jgi:chemotaxis protein MotB
MAEGTIIIKKIKKGGAEHHGGAWKIAYADFMTAMMAFFLLLWLLNAVTEEQLEGISDYFAPTTVSDSTSGGGKMLDGGTVRGKGASESSGGEPAITITLPPPTIGTAEFESFSDAELDSMTESELNELLAKKEKEEFEKVADAIRATIENSPSLNDLKKNLLIDETEEGLRIQLMDQEGRSLFPSGSAKMHPYTRDLLRTIAQIIRPMPQKLMISGSTDSTKFVNSNAYSNWELSSDRAQASRKVLTGAGIPDARMAKIVGNADRDPLYADDPADPRNRRISIVLLRNTGNETARAKPEPAPEPALNPPPSIFGNGEADSANPVNAIGLEN